MYILYIYDLNNVHGFKPYINIIYIYIHYIYNTNLEDCPCKGALNEEEEATVPASEKELAASASLEVS